MIYNDCKPVDYFIEECCSNIAFIADICHEHDIFIYY